MAKARGLPDTFKLNVSSSITAPVELGDYLDEERQPPKPAPRPPQAPQVAAEAPAPHPIRVPIPSEAPVAATLPEKPALRPAEGALFPERMLRPVVAAPPRPARLAGSVPRKQVNMNPETLAMVDELVDFVQTYSVQKDLAASELFHALVLTLFEAREELDLSRVQPRGRWGTPTAAALPIALKNAMQKAIQQYCESRK